MTETHTAPAPVDSVKVPKLAHDDITRLLSKQIVEGVNQINAANEILLAEETEAGVREIDKGLKAGTANTDVNSAWDQAESAKNAYRDALNAARNLYRTEILGEDAVSDNASGDVDKDEVKEVRKLITEALTLLKTYATANGKRDVVDWVSALEIPQVGRQGTSVLGQKKPRAYVSVDGTVYETFGEAAKAVSELLSTEDTIVTFSSGELVSAWQAAGSITSEFDFQGVMVKVTEKPKKSTK